MIEVIKDPTLENLNEIQHGFFTRQGGVSEGCYASLNCSYACDDDPSHVTENRRRALSYLHHPLETLVTVKNVHGNKVCRVEKPWTEQEKPEADGMVTKLPNVILGSDSADCPIVLLADVEAGVIGLAHAGWRSAKHGIIKETIKQMVELEARYNQIVAVIGPCLAQAHYDIDFEFYKQFITESQDNQQFFMPATKIDHFLFDLQGYVKASLVMLGLKSVSAVNIDTFSDEDRFFSCRRSRLRGEMDFGGHLSCIGLKKR